jgi:hypothetical protein
MYQPCTGGQACLLLNTMQRHATIAERVIITGLFAAVLVLATTPHGEAAVAPLSPAELRERADVVVVAKVTLPLELWLIGAVATSRATGVVWRSQKGAVWLANGELPDS